MYEVTEFIKKNHTFYLCTLSGEDQPELRPIGIFEEYDGRIYTAVGMHKKVYRQITANPQVALCAVDGTNWIRLRATAVTNVPKNIVDRIFADNPFLRTIYNRESRRRLGVIELANASVEFCGLNGPERVENLPGTRRNILPKAKKYEGLSQLRPPLCYELVGRSFELVMDTGYDYEMKFIDRNTLSYGLIDGEKNEYRYECLKVDDTTYFINFEMSGASPRTGMSFVLDLEQSLTTCVIVREGLNPRLPKLPSTEIVFGALRKEDNTVPKIRHGYTSDMVGTAILWHYATFDIIHLYSSERYYRGVLPREAIERMSAGIPDVPGQTGDAPVRFFEEPSDYVKIKDGVYLFSFVESDMARAGLNGNAMCFLMNLNRMYDVGRSFGYNADGERENYMFGAYGEYVEPDPTIDRKSISYIR
jgi:uncharacterized pyridoxamine 5'-phosphate oxidase family protein